MNRSKKAKSKKAPAAAPTTAKRAKELRDDQLAAVAGGITIAVRDGLPGHGSGGGPGK
jgi:hypothetical protein